VSDYMKHLQVLKQRLWLIFHWMMYYHLSSLMNAGSNIILHSVWILILKEEKQSLV
jgi:hypothetical protein